MRSSRLVKYRKKHKKLILFTQVMVIIYASIVSVSLLTSSTVAYYSDGSMVNATISSASDWWDGSKLEFPNKASDVVLTCPQVNISVVLENNGDDMTKPTNYEVYYSEQKGNPAKHGDLISEGEVSPIESEDTALLTHEAEHEGWYVFKVIQRQGFDNNYDERSEIWSNDIKVKCNDNKKSSEPTEVDEDTENGVEKSEDEAVIEEEESTAGDSDGTDDTTSEDIEEVSNNENDSDNKDQTTDDEQSNNEEKENSTEEVKENQGNEKIEEKDKEGDN